MLVPEAQRLSDCYEARGRAVDAAEDAFEDLGLARLRVYRHGWAGDAASIQAPKRSTGSRARRASHGMLPFSTKYRQPLRGTRRLSDTPGVRAPPARLRGIEIQLVTVGTRRDVINDGVGRGSAGW